MWDKSWLWINFGTVAKAGTTKVYATDVLTYTDNYISIPLSVHNKIVSSTSFSNELSVTLVQEDSAIKG